MGNSCYRLVRSLIFITDGLPKTPCLVSPMESVGQEADLWERISLAYVQWIVRKKLSKSHRGGIWERILLRISEEVPHRVAALVRDNRHFAVNFTECIFAQGDMMPPLKGFNLLLERLYIPSQDLASITDMVSTVSIAHEEIGNEVYAAELKQIVDMLNGRIGHPTKDPSVKEKSKLLANRTWHMKS